MTDTDTVKTRVVGYGLNSKIGEIVDGLKYYRNLGEDPKKSTVWQASEFILEKLGKEFDDLDKEIRFLEDLGLDNTIAQVLESNSNIHQESNDDLGKSKALNASELKVLLEEERKHQEEKDLLKVAEEAKKNQKLRNTQVSDMVKVLQERERLRIEEEKINGGDRKKATEISKQELITEARLVEQGIAEEKADLLAKKMIERNKEEVAFTKNDAINILDTNDKELVEEVLQIARVSKFQETINSEIETAAIRIVDRVTPKGNTASATEILEVQREIEELIYSNELTQKEIVAEAGIRIAKILGVTDPVTAQIATEESVKMLEGGFSKKEEAVKMVKDQEEFDQMWSDLVKANPGMSETSSGVAREYVWEVARLPESGLEQFRSDAVNQTSGTRDDKGNIISRTQAEGNFDQLNTAVEIARGGKGKIDNLARLRARLSTMDTKIPFVNKKLRETDAVMSLIQKDPGLAKVMASVGNKITSFNNFYNGLGYKVFTKVGGERAVTWLATKIGGEAGKSIATSGLKIIASKGFEAGIKNIFGQLAGKVGLQVTASLTGKGLVTVGAKGLVGLLGLSNPVGWVITLGLFALDFIKGVFNWGKKTIQKITDTLGISMPSVKGWLQDNFGKVGGTALIYGTGFFGGLLGIPAMISIGWMINLIRPVTLILILGIVFYTLVPQQNQITSIKPPEGMGGGQCVKKSEQANLGGAINCNQNAPEVNYPGLTKAKFSQLADRWTTGKNYAEECYNDVVNRAMCAGVNPAYALWVWAHESGASNYSIADVEDFGIHGRSDIPVKDFDAQINYFLTLDMGAYCAGAPKIGNDYWLGLATNFLNGGCDPDVVNATTGETGRDYKKSIMTQWAWVTDQPMPSSIKIGAEGANCGGGNEKTGTYDFKDQEGNDWVCTKNTTNNGGMVPNFEPWNIGTSVPEGCPEGLPMHTGVFTQGPFAPGCSHQSMSTPALDIGVGAGTEIRATHDGVVSQHFDNIYGYYVDLHGTCGGKDFYTRYAHMPEGGYRTDNKVTVKKGDVIGVVDTTGSSTGNHLHFHIYNLETNKFGQYLGLSVQDTEKLWACCNGENGKYCPTLK